VSVGGGLFLLRLNTGLVDISGFKDNTSQTIFWRVYNVRRLRAGKFNSMFTPFPIFNFQFSI
jgi:hypothetical protein